MWKPTESTWYHARHTVGLPEFWFPLPQRFRCEWRGYSPWWKPYKRLLIKQPPGDTWGPIVTQSCLWIKPHCSSLYNCRCVESQRIWENSFVRYFLPAGKALGNGIWNGIWTQREEFLEQSSFVFFGISSGQAALTRAMSLRAFGSFDTAGEAVWTLEDFQSACGGKMSR